MKRLLILIFNFLILTYVSKGFSAACCGGGFAAPSVISDDGKAQLTTSYLFTQVHIDNVSPHGIWKKSTEQQHLQVLQIEGAHIFSDLWQVGVSSSFIERSKFNQSYSGLGDTFVTLGYEYLTNWNYKPFRPRGVGYIKLVLPTGRSTADSEVGGLDSRGNGFFALGVGTLLTKSFKKIDVFSNIETHYSFSKSVKNSNLNGEIKPGLGGNISLGLGYNISNWRIGSSASFNYESPIDIISASPSKGQLERYASMVFSLSYLKSLNWAGTISYSDQSILGSPSNTSLGKTILVQIQRKWSR